jgi:hypothetical protein
MARAMERSDDAALKQAEDAELAKVRQSYTAYRAACGDAKTRPTVEGFLRKYPPAMFIVRWTDHAGQPKRTAPSDRFMRAIRDQLGTTEQMDVATDNYFNNMAGAAAAQQTSTKGKQRALDFGDKIERQRALLRQQQKRSSGGGVSSNDPPSAEQ